MHNKLTKIVATISDRHCDIDFLTQLYKAGMNAVRLNTAHQDPKGSLKVIENTRKVSEKIAIMVDTKGPEVRTVLHGDAFSVKTGDKIAISNEKLEGLCFSTNYDGFIQDLSVGDTILIDDGSLGMRVIEKSGSQLLCEALNDEKLEDKKSLNVPNAHLKVPSLSQKDLSFIDFAIQHNVDFIAHSFVRNAEDVKAIQDILDAQNSKVKIIAKIENKEGIDNINEILTATAGIMIARGDLGIEIPAEQVPAYQKYIIEMCRKRKRPVITATQMLHTMIDNPRPTRAEVSDVANAVYDGTDALMLSGETAYGKYPLEAVETMTTIALETEKAIAINQIKAWKDPKNNQRNFLARGVAYACVDLPVKAVLSDTETGRSARILSAYRINVPIFAKAPSMRVVRELALSFGIFPDFMDYQASTDKLVENSLSSLLELNVIDRNDLVVIMGGAPGQSEGTNFIEINKAATCLKLYKDSVQ